MKIGYTLKVVLLFLAAMVSTYMTKAQRVDYHGYSFAKLSVFSHCNYFSFKFNGTKQFDFGQHFSDEVGCNRDSFHACQIFTPSIGYLPDNYFNSGISHEKRIKLLVIS